jgi:hypothetical protein
MTMTDPIADMLTRLRNANQAYHESTSMPYSKIKQGIADILQQEGYISSYTVEEPKEGVVGKTLVVDLKFGPSRERSIAGVRRISKVDRPAQGPRWPGRRDHLDVPGTADGPPGQEQGRRRGSPRLRLVTKNRKEDH